MSLLHEYTDSLIRLLYPHICHACGDDVFQRQQYLCWRCQEALPFTQFETMDENPVRKVFTGRIPLQAASSILYFAKDSLTQAVVHQMKYRNEQDLGLWLGHLMGTRLAQAAAYNSIDAIVPLPLNERKLRMRGYNQADLLARGMAAAMQKPVESVAVMRTHYSASQTRKTRLQRWLNVEHVFDLQQAQRLEGLHVLLVDDVITTGATMEACGQVLLKIPGLRLSVCSLAYATH